MITKQVNDKIVPLTAEETAQRQADEAKWLAEKNAPGPTIDEQAEKLFTDNDLVIIVASRLADLAGHDLETEKGELVKKYKALRRPDAPRDVEVELARTSPNFRPRQ